MALIKSLEIDNTGIFCEYWRITKIIINWEERSLLAVVNGYVSKEARENGKLSNIRNTYTFLGDSFTYSHLSNLTAETYVKLRENSECELFESKDDL